MKKSAILFLTIIFLLGCSTGKKDAKVDLIPDSNKTNENEVTNLQETTTAMEEDNVNSDQMSQEEVDTFLDQLFKDVHFDFNRYEIKTKDLHTLSEIAEYLSEKANVKIVIEGHTDEIGSEEYNLALGDKRAKAIKKYLVKYGVKNFRINTVSFGEEKPSNEANSSEAHDENRRGSFEVNK